MFSIESSSPSSGEFARRSAAIACFLVLVTNASANAFKAADAPPFSPPFLSFGTGSQPNSVAIGDLNGDGKPDLAVSNYGSSVVSVLLGHGDGTFGPRTDFGAGYANYSVAIADLNGDGKPDLAVSSNFASGHSGAVSVLLGNGDGSFGVKTDFPTGVTPASVAIGDLNGDGRCDLAVAVQFDAAVSVFLGNGDGTFGARTNYSAGSNPLSVAIADVNRDGKPDLAVTSIESTGLAAVSVLLGVGDGSFGARTAFGTGNQANAVAIGDLNGDGNPDLVVTNYASNSVSVLLGSGDGTFAVKTDFATGNGPSSVSIRDLNGDGKPDLAVANFGYGMAGNTVSVLLGRGDGSFGAKTDFVPGNRPHSVAIGDLNGNGTPDVVCANEWDDAVSVMLNNSPDLPTPTLVTQFCAALTADGVRIEWQLSDPSAFQSIEPQRSESETGAWSNLGQLPHVQGEVFSVLDASASAGEEQWYRLFGLQRDGRTFTFGPISVKAHEAVTAFALPPLSPNPTRGRLTLTFAVPARTVVRLSLLDVQGREVAVLADGAREAGRFTAALEVSDLCEGVYFVRMQADGLSLTRRIVVLK